MRALVVFFLLTSPAIGAPICHPDAGDLLTQWNAVFVDLIDAAGETWDQVMVVQVGEHLEAVRLKDGCARWAGVWLGKAPLRV